MINIIIRGSLSFLLCPLIIVLIIKGMKITIRVSCVRAYILIARVQFYSQAHSFTARSNNKPAYYYYCVRTREQPSEWILRLGDLNVMKGAAHSIMIGVVRAWIHALIAFTSFIWFAWKWRRKNYSHECSLPIIPGVLIIVFGRM